MVTDNTGEIAHITGNAIDVAVQDQATPPVDSYFLKSISTFSIVSNTLQSGVTNLEYYIFVDSTNGIVAGTEILLLDTASNKDFYAEVKIVTNNMLRVDRPIDHAFPTNSTLGRTVTSEMAVDGSITPQIYTARAGAIPRDITRVIVTIIDNASMDDGKFGGILSLSNGFVFRIVDSFNKTIFNFKNNGEFGNFCYDTAYVPASQGPLGSEGFKARITFGGQAKHGVVLRIQDDDVLQWIVQDNLSNLVSLKAVLQGHLTIGE
jgi:hypothetical protein